MDVSRRSFVKAGAIAMASAAAAGAAASLDGARREPLAWASEAADAPADGVYQAV